MGTAEVLRDAQRSQAAFAATAQRKQELLEAAVAAGLSYEIKLWSRGVEYWECQHHEIMFNENNGTLFVRDAHIDMEVRVYSAGEWIGMRLVSRVGDEWKRWCVGDAYDNRTLHDKS